MHSLGQSESICIIVSNYVSSRVALKDAWLGQQQRDIMSIITVAIPLSSHSCLIPLSQRQPPWCRFAARRTLVGASCRRSCKLVGWSLFEKVSLFILSHKWVDLSVIYAYIYIYILHLTASYSAYPANLKLVGGFNHPETCPLLYSFRIIILGLEWEWHLWNRTRTSWRKSFPTRPGVWVPKSWQLKTDVFPCDSRQACRQVSLPRPSLDLPSEEFWAGGYQNGW